MSDLERVFATAFEYNHVGDPMADDMGGSPVRVHDWRNHVGDLAEIWSGLSRDARMAAYVIAVEAAGNEHWD